MFYADTIDVSDQYQRQQWHSHIR